MRSRFDLPIGNGPWQGGASADGWRRNGRKAECVNQGDLLVTETVILPLAQCRRPARAGDRAPVVARKGRNGPGAKGAQEGGDVTPEPKQATPDVVPARGATPPGEIRARWAWVEAEVWTERMLTALEQGVIGGKWFSLRDKVYALPNLRQAFVRVKANDGAPGVDQVTVKEFERHLEANLEKLARSLKDGSYRPQAIRREWIDKPGSQEKRPLGIPTVRADCTCAPLAFGMGGNISSLPPAARSAIGSSQETARSRRRHAHPPRVGAWYPQRSARVDRLG